FTLRAPPHAPREAPRSMARPRTRRARPAVRGAAHGGAARSAAGAQRPPPPKRRLGRPAGSLWLSPLLSPRPWDDCALRLLTLGDVLLDVIVLLSDPLAPGGDVRSSNRVGAGGQAANVAAWAAELGAEARCIAKRGDDLAGELVARELGIRGVELVGPVGEGDTGVVVSTVDAGDRSLASDRGVAPAFAPEGLD